MSVCVSSTGLDWSISVVSGSRFLRASMASVVLPLTSRRQLRAEPADRDVRLVDDRLEVVLRDRLQAAVGVASRTVLMSVGTVVRSCGITSPSFSTGPLPLRGSSCDELLADGGHAVHLGFEVGGDLDVRVQRQHRRDAGVGEVDAFHRADLRRRGR